MTNLQAKSETSALVHLFRRLKKFDRIYMKLWGWTGIEAYYEEVDHLIKADRSKEVEMEPWQRLHEDLGQLSLTCDRSAVRYTALSSLTAGLAGISAVVAALSIQLLSSDHHALTIAGFLVAVLSFIICAVASVGGARGAELLRLQRIYVEPYSKNLDLLNGAIKNEEVRLIGVLANVRIRSVVAATAILLMTIALVMMALGQLQ